MNIDGKYFIKKGKYYFFYSEGSWTKSMAKSESVKIYYLDNKGSIINKYLKVKEVGLYSFSSPEFLSEYGKEVFFDYAPYGIIFKINEHSCKPVYRIEINGYSMKEKELLSMKDLRAPERFRKLINELQYRTN